MSETHDLTDPQLELLLASPDDRFHAILTKLDGVLAQLRDVAEWLETVDVRIRDIEENRF